MNPERDAARCFMPYPAVPVDHAPTGPLAGLSFAVKDLFDVAGYPTSGGNPHLLAMSGIKASNAPVVQALLDAGARFAGKVITDELAYSMAGKNAHFGAPVNGAAPDRITGGSSSGSASAVSHGLVDFSLGSDTGGSVRCPASHCGLFGIRPTQGRIDLHGCLPLAASFDTCGFFARDGLTFARVADVLLGADSSPLPAKPSVLIAQDMFDLLDPSVRLDVDPIAHGVIERLGGGRSISVTEQTGHDFDSLYWAHRLCQAWEAWQANGPTILRLGLQLGPGVRERFDAAREIADVQWHAQNAVREAFAARFRRMLGDHVLLLPTMPDVAPLSSASEASLDDYRNRSIRLLCVAGLAGCPQVSVPLVHRAGVPMGLSLIGPQGSDRSLLSIAVGMAG